MRNSRTNRGRSLYRLPMGPRGAPPPMGPPPRPRVPPELEHSTLIMLLDTARSGIMHVERALAPLALVLPHVSLLMTLKADGPQSQIALTKPSHIDRTTMVAFIDYLEEKGLVERAKDPRDRRAHQVSLTRAGIEVVEQICAAHEAAEAKLLRPLTPDDRAALRDLLERILAADAADNEGPPSAP